jgi:hypothetical protein
MCGATWTTSTPHPTIRAKHAVSGSKVEQNQRNSARFQRNHAMTQGRVLYGYSDGCVTAGCIAGTAPNDFVAFMRIARQSGGKGLYARF